jgi:hypothetical protein
MHINVVKFSRASITVDSVIIVFLRPFLGTVTHTRTR